MKKSILPLIFIFAFLELSVARPFQKAEPDSQRTEIVLVGTLHGSHNDNPHYSSQDLRQIIADLKPAAIMIEIPRNQMGADGRVLQQDRVGPELTVTDQVSRELNIRQIPFDDPDRNDLNNELNTRSELVQASAARIGQEMSRRDSTSLDQQVLHLKAEMDRTIERLARENPPTILNSDAYDALFRTKYSLDQEISISVVQSYPGHEDLLDYLGYAREQWDNRNAIMARNIVNAARSFLGKRLVVLVGGAHRYILRELLTREKAISLERMSLLWA
jgi:hypothetical protein